MWAPNCAFSSLTDNIYIVGLMSEITHAFDHFLTQLTLVGLRVKVSKCKLKSPSGFSLNIEISQGYILVTNGLCILGMFVGSQNFAMHFFMTLYLKTWYISIIFLSYEMPRLLWAFCPHV